MCLPLPQAGGKGFKAPSESLKDPVGRDSKWPTVFCTVGLGSASRGPDWPTCLGTCPEHLDCWPRGLCGRGLQNQLHQTWNPGLLFWLALENCLSLFCLNMGPNSLNKAGSEPALVPRTHRTLTLQRCSWTRDSPAGDYISWLPLQLGYD